MSPSPVGTHTDQVRAKESGVMMGSEPWPCWESRSWLQSGELENHHQEHPARNTSVPPLGTTQVAGPCPLP